MRIVLVVMVLPTCQQAAQCHQSDLHDVGLKHVPSWMPDFIDMHSVLYGWLMSQLYAISFDVCSPLRQSPKRAWCDPVEDFVLLIGNTDSGHYAGPDRKVR